MYEFLKDQLMLLALLFVLLVVPQLQGCATIYEMNTSTQHCFRGNEEISCFDFSIPW